MEYLFLTAALGVIVGVLLSELLAQWLWLPLLGVFTAVLFAFFVALRPGRTVRAPGFLHHCLIRFLNRPWLILAVLLILVISVARGHLWLQQQLQHRLPPSLDRIQCQGVFWIESVVPQSKSTSPYPNTDIHHASGNGYTPFILARQKARVVVDHWIDCPEVSVRKLDLSLYRSAFRMQAGDHVTATVRLRAPFAMLNGLFFDYEAWAIQKGLDARGYVVAREDGIRLSEQVIKPSLYQQWVGLVEAFRSKAQTVLIDPLPDNAQRWVKGLVFGQQNAFDSEHWHLAKQTGTVHLLVVSGLHMGMVVLAVAGMVSILLRIVGLFVPMKVGWRHWLQIVLVVMLSAAFVLLAGAGIALIRAWLMVLVGLFVWQRGLRVPVPLAISVAVAVVLWVNPMMFMAAGFWLSFGAVALLLMLLRGRRLTVMGAALVPQWLVFVGLVPLLLLVNTGQPSVSVVANLICIPLMTLVMLPAALLTALLSALSKVLFGALFGGVIGSAPGTEKIIAWLDVIWGILDGLWWQLLQWFASLQWPVLYQLPWLGVLGWLLLVVLASRLVSPVWLALTQVVALAVLVLVPRTNTVGVYFLDVGQGLAVIASGRDGSLVYDLGYGNRDGFSIAERVLIPRLDSHPHAEVNTLVLSHADKDHAGGLSDWLQRYQNDIRHGRQQLVGGESAIEYLSLLPPRQHSLVESRMMSCHKQGEMLWHSLGGLDYRFFPVAEHKRQNGNDGSCVMQLRLGPVRVLLPGDISTSVERHLVDVYGDELASDVLVAGHHGSGSSSHKDFIAMVNPATVIVSAGFGNPYKHPHPKVIERLSESVVYVSWKTGLISLAADGKLHTFSSVWQPPWRQSR